jgi:ABC-2 type transport system permease protein
MSSGSPATAIWSLIEREFVLILRNRHLLFLLLFPTTLQLLLIGFALNPGLRHENLAVFDESNTSSSRAFVTVLQNTGMFSAINLCPWQTDASRLFADGTAKAILSIPHAFQPDLDHLHVASVQFILDGTDAYTASLCKGYLVETTLQAGGRGVHASSVEPNVHIMFNPGLISAWYFIPGLIGALLTLSATLVSSAVMLRERESGTLEHLLMLPVTSTELFAAKVLPLFALLCVDLLIALVISKLVFGLPIRGALWLFLLLSAIYIIIVIGIGVLIGTVCSNQKQAKFLSFFINIPMILFSGILVPLNTMPKAFQLLSSIDPLRFYRACATGILLKGWGVSDLPFEITGLCVGALLIVCANIWRFRIHST